MAKITTILLVTVWAACGCGLFKGPEDVARAYLEAGAEGGSGDVSSLVESGCADESIMGVSAVKMMGVPMKIEKLEVKLDGKNGDRATVSYTAQGSAEGGGETEILGITVEAENVSVGSLTRSGELDLVKEGTGWKVACPD
jgi:hypothetical protein